MSKLDDWIKHSINKELYGNGVKEESVQLLTELYEELIKRINSVAYISSRKLYEQLLEEVEERLQQFGVDYKRILRDHIKTVSETESEWVKDFLLGVGVSVVVPATLFSSVKFSPVASQSNYESVVSNVVTDIKNSITTSLKTAYLTKEATSSVTERLETKEARIEKVVENETATINTTAFNMTDYIIYKQNKRKVRYSAILDNHTCSVCGLYDGQIFEAGNAPLIPVHENCRCTLIDEAIIEDEIPTYSEWFETLEEEEKKYILGPGRYELYQAGLGLDRFVNNGQKITLKELKAQLNQEKN